MNRKELLISTATVSVKSQFEDVWRHRDLLRYLVVREINTAFANTKIGMFWFLLKPLATALVLTFVFSILVRIPTEGIPYPLVILSAFPFYLYFNSVVTQSASSMSTNAHLLTKVYFPRLIIVLVPVLAGMIDMLVLLLVVLAAAPFFGTQPTFTWFALVVPFALVVFLALGTGLLLSQLTMHFQDIRHALPVMMQITLYITPIIYPVALVPTDWRWLYDLNPMVGIVETARWALLGSELPLYALIVSVVLTSLILVSGFFVFRLLEDTAADLI